MNTATMIIMFVIAVISVITNIRIFVAEYLKDNDSMNTATKILMFVIAVISVIIGKER